MLAWYCINIMGVLSISCRHFRRKWRLGGANSNSDNNNGNSNSIMESSSVEVLSGVVFFSAAERPFRARSAAERRGAR